MGVGGWWNLASVKILHELRCHEVFEDMDDVTRFCAFLFCNATCRATIQWTRRKNEI